MYLISRYLYFDGHVTFYAPSLPMNTHIKENLNFTKIHEINYCTCNGLLALSVPKILHDVLNILNMKLSCDRID